MIQDAIHIAREVVCFVLVTASAVTIVAAAAVVFGN
jgi:hypothetical protein